MGQRPVGAAITTREGCKMKRKVIWRGDRPLVMDCPNSKSVLSGVSCADALEDCLGCQHLQKIETTETDGEEEDFVLCPDVGNPSG